MRKFEVVRDEHRKHPEVEIKLPVRATKHSVAYDFYSPVSVTIQPNEKVFIWTDVKVHMYYDNALLINVRSSMGKQPIMIANTQGWIESDYADNPDNDGNIGFNLLNLGNTPYEIVAGDRIGQGMFVKYFITNDDDARNEREGGYGSTGK